VSTRDYTVVCYSEAASPLTHMKGVSGNEALVAREPVVTPAGVRWVPHLSGNAIRHRLVRGCGFRWLIGEYGLAGRLTLPQLNFLLHGGNLTEGGGREDTRRIADYQRLFPLGRLLGGALPDQILAGSLQAWRGTLVCEENRRHLAAALPDPSVLPPKLRPAESLVSGYQYTRGDAAKGETDLMKPRAGDEDAPASSNLMIFAGQAVTRGAAFVHGFTLPHVSELELGALLWSLRLWRAAGGTIGGMAARGHGRLATSVLAGDFDPDAACDAYVAHARSVKDEAVAWLHSAFAPRAEKAAEKKGKGKGKPAAVAAAEDADG
jgi:hypothetical protein